MEYWKTINDLLEKRYGCMITMKFNQVEDKIVIYKYDISGKSAGQPTSWSKEDLEHLINEMR